MKKEFELGTCVITPSCLSLIGTEGAIISLARHSGGDWGELSEEDKKANEKALEEGERILSKYTMGSGETIWVITEGDRSYTAILFPNEY